MTSNVSNAFATGRQRFDIEHSLDNRKSVQLLPPLGSTTATHATGVSELSASCAHARAGRQTKIPVACVADHATTPNALAVIRSAGITLRMDGPRLLASPRSAVTADVARLIIKHRNELIALLRPLPCPIDILEAAAIHAEAGTDPDVAEIDALTMTGFRSWGELAQRMATDIASELAAVPKPTSTVGAKLLHATHVFVRSPAFASAVAAGWSIPSLFAIPDPHDLPQGAGLVVRLALGSGNMKLVEIDADKATLKKPDGRQVWLDRHSAPELEAFPPWWQSPAIVGEGE